MKSFTPNAVTATQAARLAGVSRQAVHHRAGKGKLAAFEFHGETMYRVRDVLAWKRLRERRARQILARGAK